MLDLFLNPAMMSSLSVLHFIVTYCFSHGSAAVKRQHDEGHCYIKKEKALTGAYLKFQWWGTWWHADRCGGGEVT